MEKSEVVVISTPKKKVVKAKKEVAIIEVSVFHEIIQSQPPALLTKAEGHAMAFSHIMTEFNELKTIISTVDRENPTKEDVKKLYTNRQRMVKLRTETGSIKDIRKADIKLEDNLIMSIHNMVVDTLKLTESEFKAIETIEEAREVIRLDDVEKSRKEELSKYGEVNVHIDLRAMDDEGYSSLLDDSKLLFEAKETARLKKIEDDKILATAETERLRLLSLSAAKVKLIADTKALRIKEIASIGFTSDGESFLVDSDKIIMIETLGSVPEAKYKQMLSAGVKKLEAYKTAQAVTQAKEQADSDKAAQDLADLMAGQHKLRFKAVSLALAAIGYVPNDSESLRHKIYGCVIMNAEINTFDKDEDCDAYLKVQSDHIAKLEKSAASKLAKAPDREKIIIFAGKLKELIDTIPGLKEGIKSKEGKTLVDGIEEIMGVAQTYIKREFAKLKE